MAVFHERARRGRVRGTSGADSKIEIGVAPGLELRIGQAGAYGNLETRRRLDAAGFDQPGPEAAGRAAWGRASRFGALYELFGGRVRAVYGPGRPAQEAEGVLPTGTILGSAARPLGLPLNLDVTSRFDPLPGERSSPGFVSVSVGQAVTFDTALVATWVRERQERGERDVSLIQAGVRHRLSAAGPVLGIAIGAGLNRDSPSLQAAVAVQGPLGPAGR